MRGFQLKFVEHRTTLHGMTAYFDGREMAMLHRMFRREFLLAGGLVMNTTTNDRAELVADHITSVGTTLHHHHHMEDTHVWPLLEKRCPDDIVDIVTLMENQHASVAKYGEEITEAMAAWRTNFGPATRNALVAALDRLVPALLEHLDTEEERVVPLMEKHIAMDEWNKHVAEGIAEIDPQELMVGFGMAMYEGDEDIIAATVENMPLDVRPVIRDVASKAYAERAKALYGTATPPRSWELV